MTNENKLVSQSRRSFLKKAGLTTAATMAVSAIGIDSIRGRDGARAEAATGSTADSNSRCDQAYQVRVNAAGAERTITSPPDSNNSDESLYRNRIGNYSKGLPHNSNGEVDPGAYNKLLKAIGSGNPADFAQIPLAGPTRLVDPQAGLAFDLEGTDSHRLAIPPAPTLASAQRAGEAVEDYWAALLRDVPFSQYGSHPLAAMAIKDLNNLSDFRGPQNNGNVTAGTLFRGFTSADLIGPYVSQFLYTTLQYGAAEVVQQFQTYLPAGNGGSDYLLTFDEWLACQNGAGPIGTNQIDPQRRYIRNGRDLAAYVHVDVLFEAYFNACLYLIDIGAPLNPANPYISSTNQTGFGTFGAPHIKTLVAEVATRALKAVWYQKWFVHRALRPEAYGGLVHLTKTGVTNYPIHSDVLNSEALVQAHSTNGTYLFPCAFPEGCPQHPSYAEGHGTVGGACVTIIKAFFDENFVLPDPVVPSDDGLTLNPYTGSDAGQLTLGGEVNKLAANISIGRCHAGVHWRSDNAEALKLGEAIAISVLRDQRATYNEAFNGFTFTKFDGTTITV